MIKLKLFEDKEWVKDTFHKFFKNESWKNIPSSYRKDQILYRDWDEYGWHFLLKSEIINWLLEKGLDYSIEYETTKTDIFDQSERLTAYINLPTTEDAVLFKLTWV